MKNGDTVLDRRYPKSEPWPLYRLHECYEWRIQRRSLTLTRDWTHCEWIWRGGWIYRRRNRRSIQPWINNRNRRPLCMRPLLSILGLSVCVCVCTEKRRYDGFGKKCRTRSGVEHRYKEERDTYSKILGTFILLFYVTRLMVQICTICFLNFSSDGPCLFCSTNFSKRANDRK